MNYPYPPWWGPPPPQHNQHNHRMNDRELNKIAKNAVRDAMRLRDQDKNSKRKRKDERMKKAAASRQKFFTFIEIFILGVLMHPIIGPLYHHLIEKASP